MNKFFKILFAYFVLILLFQFTQISGSKVQAQSKQKKQSELTVAPVPLQKIENYHQDNDFKYIKQPPVFDFWGIVLKWLMDFLKVIFSDQGAAPYIRYVVIILVIAFAISKILRGNFSGILTKNKKSGNGNGLEYGLDNIHEIDFEKEIKTAVKEQNFRLATRFLYLKLLKVLNEIEYINWQPGKTNLTYQNELNNTNISNSFKKLSEMYEYSWYGHFHLNQSEFEQLSKEFEISFSSLKLGRK